MRKYRVPVWVWVSPRTSRVAVTEPTAASPGHSWSSSRSMSWQTAARRVSTRPWPFSMCTPENRMFPAFPGSSKNSFTSSAGIVMPGPTVPVRMDGTSRQQKKETRKPLPVRPGQPAGCDFEQERNGAANLFMMYAPLDSWRHVRVTDRRTRQDFARVPRDLAVVRFPRKRIVLVMDNLNTHRLSTPCDAFEPAEASRLAGRFEVLHTPKHGSLPDMAGSGISVLSRRCLDRRIPDRETMIGEVAAWQDRRDDSAKPVAWRFRTEDARIRLKSPYLSIR